MNISYHSVFLILHHNKHKYKRRLLIHKSFIIQKNSSPGEYLKLIFFNFLYMKDCILYFRLIHTFFRLHLYNFSSI